MFGQSGNTSFGFNTGTQNSPFGQSAFGKTATTSFGTSAPPVFGSNTSLFSAKPAGTTTGGLFGNTTSTQPTFGASTATQSTFGGFGTTNTNTPLFGAQQNANTSLFGSTNTATAFGQANKPATFGFGQTTGTGLFGQPQQQATQQTVPFGQSTTTGSTSLFGASSGFGTTNTVGVTGTVIKFNPVNGSDTMVKNGVQQTISTRHHCITCMKEYEGKSLEELRLEDYQAGRKGAAQGQAPAIFGAAATQSSPFGTAVSNSNTTNTGFGGMSGGFGSTAQTGTGLFSKPMTGFGAPATTSTSFPFNSTTSSNLFNTQSKPFGATTSTPLFSASNPTSTAGNAFGTLNTQNTGFGSTGFGTAQANQSIGLFSQNKSAFNMPSSTATTSFGFNQASTTNTGGLFGAAAKPAATGFGATASTFQTGTTGFGAAPNTSTSLFNSSFKPTGQTGGFSFGNTPSVSTTGLGTTGTSLFNTSKPSLFGNTGNSSFNFGTFNLGTAPTFGTNTGTLSTLGTNLYGTGTSLNNTQQNTGSVPVHQQILALVSAPFGDSPLLKNLLPASGKSEQFLKSSNPAKGLNSSHYKVMTGNSNAKVKPKVVASIPSSKKSLFDGLEEEDPLFEAFQPRPNAKRLILRPKSNTSNDLNNKSLENEIINHNVSEAEPQITDKENDTQNTNKLANDRRTSNSWLKSSLPQKPKIIEEQYFDHSILSENSELPPTNELENTVTELRSPAVSDNKINLSTDLSAKESVELSTSANKSNADYSLQESLSMSRTDDTSSPTSLTNEIANKANVINKLQRYGYYTIPPLESLDKYVKDNTCIVPNFTIGRKGYGNVFFADSFDIYGLNLDEIVHFRHKEIIIYPDDNVKPPVGQGLNRKAQVTLDRVWPIDKSTHEPITDPQRLTEMDYEGKLRRVSAKHGTRFLEYRPETGSWVFKVDHFSKYGLNDSDDKEILISESKNHHT